jgi:hypothetical protein
MRYFSTASPPLERHRAWLDGLVLVCTVLFGLLLAYFITDVLPAGASPRTVADAVAVSLGDASRFLPLGPPALPPRPVGAAQQVKGFVIQVAAVGHSPAEGGREAPRGSQFLTATVVMDNQGRQPISYSLADWKARDPRGRAHAAEPLRGAGWLSSGQVGPGQQVQAAVAFVVPETESTFQITFAPSGLGALLRWDTAAPN